MMVDSKLKLIFKNDLVRLITVIIMGIVIGIGIRLHGFQDKKGDHIEDTITTNTTFRSAYGIYKHAAVASDAKICSDIGRDVMEIDGGNAIDAAIAVQFCSGVLHSHSIGIGGGVLALVYDKKHGIYAIDGRETAPLATTGEIYSRPEFRAMTRLGGLSVCVPGLLKGYIEMHSKFGSLPWKRLVTPTINLLRGGFPLTVQSYEAVVRLLSPNKEKMKGFEMFLDENDNVKNQGSIVRMPKLARTMERIAEDPMSFYKGSLAQDIVNDLKDEGSIITEEDLDKYQALVKKPTALDLPGGQTLYSVPSPGSGPSLSYILSILSGYNMTAESWATEEAKIETYHRMIEAFKFSYARKTQLGDENFVDVNELVKNLTSRSYGEETRLLIDDSKTFDLSYYGPKYYGSKQHGTSHAAIVDSEGNAVAITGSINLYFGSQIAGKRTGIIFNNQMMDFSHPFLENYPGLQPAEANFIQPGKRPLSAMCPAIIWDNIKKRVSIVAGAAGGSKIPAVVAFTAMNLLWLNMSVPESIDEPRLLHELLPMNIQGDPHISLNIRAGLRKKSHTFLKPIDPTVVQMIQILEDSIVAGCDFRKLGEPSGF